jgi:hypothetical protein
MLRMCCGHTRRDRVWNDDIRDSVRVAPIEVKLIQHRLRWFEHVQRRPPKAPVCSGVLKRADNVKSGRGRPKLTWDESVKRDLKEWNNLKIDNQRAGTVTSFCRVPFMSLYVSPCFSSLLDFISNLP